MNAPTPSPRDPSASDAALVRQAQGGDRAAFAELVERHRPLLVRTCHRLVRAPDVADDLVQETVLHALLVLDSLRQPEHFGPWLIGIELNLARRWRRAQVHGRERWSFEALVGGASLQEPITSDPQVDPERFVEERELAQRVHHAVEALPPGQRAAVLLAYLAGLSQAETAAALGIPAGAVKTRLHKARVTLRRKLWAEWSQEREQTAMSAGSTPATEFVDARILDVRGTPQTPERPFRNIVLLEETAGAQRVLPIWVGIFEADSIVILLEKVEMMRPLTFTFAANVLAAAGGRLLEVRINRLTSADGTFFAEAVIEGPSGQRIVDCRPSDAICLALASGASIRVASAVMDEAGYA
jgi:RNA polymerase sigma-70 factor (ECF subfamily)